MQWVVASFWTNGLPMTQLLERVVNLLLFAFCFLPVLPLTIGWAETVRAKPKSDLLQIALLVLVSASFSWIVLALFSPLAIGPFHSETRATVIIGNAFLMFFVAIAAFIREKIVSTTALAACVTSLVWFYIALANASA